MANNCGIDLIFHGICYSQQILTVLDISDICYNYKIIENNEDIKFTITNEDDFVILSSNEKYTNIQRFTTFTENVILYSGNYKKEFRWSIENQTWSDWITLTIDNLNDYIRFAESLDVYIEFKYTMIESGLLSILSLSLNWEEHTSKFKNWRPFNIAYSREKGNNKYPVKLNPFTYNPYQQNATIKLQKDLSFMVNNLYGHEITYFRAVPNQRSKDVFFKEYSLSNVDDKPKCIKVIVPNNEFPDNKFNFNQFGIDFEMPFEVHVDKRYFEWVFGDNIIPGKRDIIYFEFTNRIYEVLSIQIVKDFMQQPIYYKLSLTKYQQKSSRIESQENRESIDEYTRGFEKLFAQEAKEESIDITNPQQNIEKSTVYDPIRKWMYPADFIAQHTVSNNTLKLFEYYYDLSFAYKTAKSYTTAIRYRVNPILEENKNLAYTAWFQEKTPKVLFKPVKSIVSITGSDIVIKFDIMPNLKAGQWLGLTTSNDTDFEIFGQVQEVKSKLSDKFIKIKVPNYILQRANTIFAGWKTDSNLVAKEIFRRNFLFGFNEDRQEGIKIDSFNSKFIRVTLNKTSFWFETEKLEIDTWYAIVINVSKLYQELNINIYTIPEQSLKDTSLVSFYSNEIKQVKDLSFNIDSEYEILSSNLLLTNIRLLSEKLETEKQSRFLNMNIITDASLAIIIDNAIPKLRLPYIANVQ